MRYKKYDVLVPPLSHLTPNPPQTFHFEGISDEFLVVSSEIIGCPNSATCKLMLS